MLIKGVFIYVFILYGEFFKGKRFVFIFRFFRFFFGIKLFYER